MQQKQHNGNICVLLTVQNYWLSNNKTWVLVLDVTLFNNTGQHSNFTQEPGSINHLLLMAHQARSGWFTGEHQGCHTHRPPALSNSVPMELTVSHPHRLTCKSVTAAGGQSISHCFQLLESSPAPELEELPMCSLMPHQDCASWLGSTPGDRSKESPGVGSCCPCRDGTRAMPSQCLSMNGQPYLGRPLEALECQPPFWKGVKVFTQAGWRASDT